MRKNISKRRWRARLMNGLWIPGMVVYHYQFMAPAGYIMDGHPTMDFYRLVPMALVDGLAGIE